MENLENIQNIAEHPDSLEDTNTQTAPPAAEAEAGTGVTDTEISALIAEAEQRGYLRGRNEQIEETLMRQPADPCATTAADDSDDSCPGFLSHIHPDFWD